MKIRIILAVFLIIVLLFTFAACSGNKDTPLTGKYVIVGITDDPDGVTFADLDAMYKEIEQDLEDYMYMEFLDDGNFTLILFGEEDAKGVYTRDGNNVTINAGGETINMTLDGKKITWHYENGANLIFEKK